jgi:hypothetical protein
LAGFVGQVGTAGLSGVPARLVRESLPGLTTESWSHDFRRGGTKGAEAANVAAAEGVGRRESVSFLCAGLVRDFLSVGESIKAGVPCFSDSPVVATGVGVRTADVEEEPRALAIEELSGSFDTNSNSLSPTIRVSPSNPGPIVLSAS